MAKSVIFLITYYISLLFYFGSQNDCTACLKVKFFDIGQGDSALITYVDKGQYKRILVDGGPHFNLDDEIEFAHLPFIDCHIDVIIISHSDADHYSGISRLLERCNVDLILFNRAAFADQKFLKFAQTLVNKSEILNVREVGAGDKLQMGDLNLYFLAPSSAQETENINQNSIVFLLDYGDVEMIFTGDRENSIHAALKEYDNIIVGNIELFKVPHHGSKKSFDPVFMSAFSVDTAVISVGKNSYGHPNPEILNNYINSGAHVRRTDLEGDIEFVYLQPLSF